MATNFSRAITVQMLIDQVTKLNDSDTVLITAATGIGRIFLNGKIKRSCCYWNCWK